jgi:hypothetical protein
MEHTQCKTISAIAYEISKNWPNVNYAAKPYLYAMRGLNGPNDYYGYDNAKSIVGYFLANARAYKGEQAKAHKAALKAICGIK